VNGRRRDSEVPLHVRFRRRAAMDFEIVMNKRQVLALLLREWRIHRLPHDRTMRFLRVSLVLFEQAPMFCQLPAGSTPSRRSWPPPPVVSPDTRAVRQFDVAAALRRHLVRHVMDKLAATTPKLTYYRHWRRDALRWALWYASIMLKEESTCFL
jgi:hypothetical protein